jgi:hypothetical protein
MMEWLNAFRKVISVIKSPAKLQRTSSMYSNYNSKYGSGYDQRQQQMDSAMNSMRKYACILLRIGAFSFLLFFFFTFELCICERCLPLVDMFGWVLLVLFGSIKSRRERQSSKAIKSWCKEQWNGCRWMCLFCQLLQQAPTVYPFDSSSFGVFGRLSIDVFAHYTKSFKFVSL